MPEHAASDVSRDFIDTVERAGDWWPEYVPWTADLAEQIRLEADEMIRSIADECGVRDLNRIKPGIAEATRAIRSEEHTSELQSLMRISYAVFCLKKKTHKLQIPDNNI